MSMSGICAMKGKVMEMKDVEKYLSLVLFMILYKIRFETVDESLKWEHPNERF